MTLYAAALLLLKPESESELPDPLSSSELESASEPEVDCPDVSGLLCHFLGLRPRPFLRGLGRSLPLGSPRLLLGEVLAL